MSLSDPFLTSSIRHCLDSSEQARSVRQTHWIEYLRSTCHDDAIKWRNKCGSMLRRIRRIREAMDKSSVESLSPSMRENRIQTAIEEYSIQTGLDYDQSKSALEHGERGGTMSEPEQRLRQFLQTSTPLLDETVVAAVSSIGDAAYSEDELLARDRPAIYQFFVWILSHSIWIVFFAVLISFFANQGSYFSSLPLLAVGVIAMAAFPFPPHAMWKWLLGYTVLVIGAKLVWQIGNICDDPESKFFFSLSSHVSKSGIPYCPPVYVVTHAQRLGLFKSATPESWISILGLIYSEIFTCLALILHLRSLFLTGRSELTPANARRRIDAKDARPTKDTYTFRFLLSLLVTVLLITDWTRISATKPVMASTSILGEGISRNYFSPGQVVAVTLFVFQIVLDRCLYTLMSHAPSDETCNPTARGARRVILVSVFAQFAFLLISMNLRIVSIFFVLYALYLVLTAYQLGFDIRPVGGKSGFLWSPGWISYYTYRAYLLVPFLDEMRMICDWVACPATSLSLFMWFKVEDCIQNLRFVQAEMDSRESLPLIRSDRACIGISAIFGLVVIITGPLIFFSGLNVLREPNPIISHLPGVGSSSMKILLHTPTLQIPLYATSQVAADSLEPDVVKDDQILAPLMAYRSSDIQRLTFPNASDTQFSIAPPLLTQLTNELSDMKEENVTISLEWSFLRPLSSSTTSSTQSVDIPATDVLQALTRSSGGVFSVPNLVPNVLYLDSTSDAKTVTEEGFHRETQLELVKGGDTSSSWWKIKDPTHARGILCLSERTVGRPSSGTSGGYSISVIGLYLGVVLTVGRFIRLSLQGSSKRISVEEFPATETLMVICQGIHIARLFKDVATEKRLYYDLVKVFRDPEMLLAATGAPS